MKFLFFVLLVVVFVVFILQRRKSEPKDYPLPSPPLPDEQRLMDEVVTVNIDMKKIMQGVEKSQQRRDQIKKNPPTPLSAGSIISTGHRHDSVYRGHCKFFITGLAGDDTIEACINTNPRSTIVSFYVNGPAPEPIDGRFYADYPTFNIKSGELRIIFEENNFMADAIKAWIIEERQKIIEKWKTKNKK